MENLLANTHELKGKMKEKIEENKELGMLSKTLATIMLDVPVEFHDKDFEMSEPDMQDVKKFFRNWSSGNCSPIFKKHSQRMRSTNEMPKGTSCFQSKRDDNSRTIFCRKRTIFLIW